MHKQQAEINKRYNAKSPAIYANDNRSHLQLQLVSGIMH
jgi:hypothetical protein